MTVSNKKFYLCFWTFFNFAFMEWKTNTLCNLLLENVETLTHKRVARPFIKSPNAETAKFYV